MKPYIICHMITSLDGGLHPSRFTASPDGSRSGWSETYEKFHNQLDGQAWLVGRVTMAEISKGGSSIETTDTANVVRPVHRAREDATRYAVALDTHGKLLFDKGDLDGDHVIVPLGKHVSDVHLARLTASGVSYIVSEGDELDLAAMMATLRRAFEVVRLLLEGGAIINGALFAAGLVDELSLLVAPALDARKAADRFVEFGEVGLAGKCSLSLISCEAAEHGLLHLRYKVDAC
jgi:riboflavin biosynthesis pyrimidine reductase